MRILLHTTGDSLLDVAEFDRELKEGEELSVPESDIKYLVKHASTPFESPLGGMVQYVRVARIHLNNP